MRRSIDVESLRAEQHEAPNGDTILDLTPMNDGSRVLIAYGYNPEAEYGELQLVRTPGQAVPHAEPDGTNSVAFAPEGAKQHATFSYGFDDQRRGVLAAGRGDDLRLRTDTPEQAGHFLVGSHEEARAVFAHFLSKVTFTYEQESRPVMNVLLAQAELLGLEGRAAKIVSMFGKAATTFLRNKRIAQVQAAASPEGVKTASPWR